MAVWIDSEGTLYWLDGDPVPGVHRDDLVLAPEPLPSSGASDIIPQPVED
jgi:hypothetical protein